MNPHPSFRAGRRNAGRAIRVSARLYASEDTYKIASKVTGEDMLQEREGAVFRGVRHPSGRAEVTLGSQPLDPRLDLRNHSPTGLEWGYAGSGPSQLALAMLAVCADDDAEATAAYQWFKWGFTSRIATDVWELPASAVTDWLDQHRKEPEVIHPVDATPAVA